MSVVIKQSFFILLFTASSLMAQGGMFGFHWPVCLEGGKYDEKKHHCYYCAEGTQPIGGDLSTTKKCGRGLLLGNHCPKGDKAWFDKKNNLCIYCETGYTFSYGHTKCKKNN